MTPRKPTIRLNLEPLDDRRLPAPIEPTNPLAFEKDAPKVTVELANRYFEPGPYVAGVAVGYATLSGHHVRLYQGQGTYREFTAYPGRPQNSNHINVAVADVTGDGVADVVTSVSDEFTYGAAAVPVQVFDGSAVLALPANSAAPSPLKPLRAWSPFGATFSGGTFVAAGDFDGDGKADVVATRAAGGPARVLIYSGADVANLKSTLAAKADFDGIADPNFTGGCHPAVGNLNPDGIPDLVVGAGYTGDPRVAGFDGASIRANWGTGTAPGRVFNDFYAYPPDPDPFTSRPGIHVAVADLDGDGYGEVLAGDRSYSTPHHRHWLAYDGHDLVTTFGGTLTLLWEKEFNARFLASDGTPRSSGTPVLTAKNLDGDGRTDLLVSYSGRSSVDFVLGRNVSRTGAMLFPMRLYPAGLLLSQGTWVG